MSDTTHTPTPWIVKAAGLFGQDNKASIGQVLSRGTKKGDELAQANAAYIVKAVNAHESLTADRGKLLKALKVLRGAVQELVDDSSGIEDAIWSELVDANFAIDQAERGGTIPRRIMVPVRHTADSEC